MKIINLNESQFTRLFEGNGDSDILNGEDTVSSFGSEVTTQTNITTPNGNKISSKPTDTNKYSKQQTPQQWGSVGGRKSSNTV